MRSNRTKALEKAVSVSEEIDILKTCLRELRKQRKKIIHLGLSCAHSDHRIQLHVRTIAILEIRLKKLLSV